MLDNVRGTWDAGAQAERPRAELDQLTTVPQDFELKLEEIQ